MARFQIILTNRLKCFDLHRIETEKAFLGDLVKKNLVNRIGFWGLFFILELQRWYWDSGSGIPLLDIRHGEILQSSDETLELQGGKSYKSLAGSLGIMI